MELPDAAIPYHGHVDNLACTLVETRRCFTTRPSFFVVFVFRSDSQKSMAPRWDGRRLSRRNGSGDVRCSGGQYRRQRAAGRALSKGCNQVPCSFVELAFPSIVELVEITRENKR